MAKMLDGPVPEGARSVSWPWYHHELEDELTPDAREVLEKYSKIPSESIESHIYRIRDKAWGIFPWPCIGEFWFLSFGLSQHPLYLTVILPRLRAGASLLDVGSCLGQDLRKCVYDGAPAASLFATDLFPEYEDLSYDLWQDRASMPKDHYIADDILASNDVFSRGNLMRGLGPGQVDIVSMTMFLHLFDYKNQLRAATRILRLLSHKPGSLILGSQAGIVEAREQELKPPFSKTETGEKRTIFRHSPASFTKLWEEAGVAAGVPLKVSAIFQVPERKKGGREKMVLKKGEGVGDDVWACAYDLFGTEGFDDDMGNAIVRCGGYEN
ncbi:uncharacterized protein KY384_004076 [Bacidia gigantensis]|uniref:uncharacterized protein n=1 Tax=Bacidia gigantensis TaxID=2732470 RepID=UPI001D03D36B|nr:uncharacterized protein KY384_004076 [Bacidia gigantensis]KAG8530719.1 hypothetical protein KY384_004076 [Bacidia gigantensis]